MQQATAAHWIDQLQMEPHPEGGFYKEMFRSQQQVKRVDEDEVRQACTSIYYLLKGGDYSGFHRIKSDEIWYFHKGEPLTIHVIDAEGVHQPLELSDQPSGRLSLVVPAGLWFAAEIGSKAGYALVSCAVAPGFEFSEFEMADGQNLSITYPVYAELFKRLCR